MARMARQWGSGTLIACGILLSSLAVAQPGVSMFADKTTGTTIRTPPPGMVIPVTCQLSEETGVPRPLDCETVSFTVLLNHSLATGLEFFVNGDFRAGTAFNPTDILPCIEPVTGGYDQRCGEEQVVDGLVQPDVHTGNCVPSCDYTVGNGKCACQDGTTGTCTCFRAWRFTVQPTKFADVGEGASVCFNATSRVLGAPTEGRCVYFSLMLPPLSLHAADPTTALTAINPVYSMEAVIGQELKIPVVSMDMNAHEVMTIDVEKFAVELPNFMWESETSCRATGMAYAGLSEPCPGGIWQRHLVYTPRMEEQGIRYKVYFKSMDDGLNDGAFINVTRFVRVPSLDGSSCGTKLGMCPSLGHPATGLVPEPRLVVTVVQKKPIFMLGVQDKVVYEQPAGAIYGLLGTQPGSPEANSTLPPAYVNCPMAPFGIYAHKDNSIVTIKLEPARVSPVDHGLVVTQNLYYWNEAGGAQTDPNAFFTYVGVNWVPPLGSEGRNYNLCFSASDEFSSSTLCFILPVARCSYCTKTDETLKEVAERFSTHWLQIWGANDAEYARLNQASFAASGVVGWSSTDNPWNLWQNTVIRLGPVYRTRHDVRLGTLAQRFRTTVKSLLEMNPDIRDMASGADDVIPAGQEACILPMICTASAGS